MGVEHLTSATPAKSQAAIRGGTAGAATGGGGQAGRFIIASPDHDVAADGAYGIQDDAVLAARDFANTVTVARTVSLRRTGALN